MSNTTYISDNFVYIKFDNDRKLNEKFESLSSKNDHFKWHCFQGDGPSQENLIGVYTDSGYDDKSEYKEARAIKFINFKDANQYEKAADKLADAPCISVNTVSELLSNINKDSSNVYGCMQNYKLPDGTTVLRCCKIKTVVRNDNNVPDEYMNSDLFTGEVLDEYNLNKNGFNLVMVVAYDILRDEAYNEPEIKTFYLGSKNNLLKSGVIGGFNGNIIPKERRPETNFIICKYFEYDEKTNNVVEKEKQFKGDISEVDSAVNFFKNTYTYSIGVYHHKEELFATPLRNVIIKKLKESNVAGIDNFKDKRIQKTDLDTCKLNCLNKENNPLFIVSVFKNILTENEKDYSVRFKEYLMFNKNLNRVVNYLKSNIHLEDNTLYKNILDNLYLYFEMCFEGAKNINYSDINKFINYLRDNVDSNLLTESVKVSESVDADGLQQKITNLFTVSDTVNNQCKRGYVTPDGKFIQLNASLSHQAFKNKLQDVYGISEEESQVENLGYIRYNLDGEGFVALSNKKPTEAQYKALEELLDAFLKVGCWRYGVFMLIEPYNVDDKVDGQIPKELFHRFEVYGSDGITTDEVIKKIRMYYNSGKIRE